MEATATNVRRTRQPRSHGMQSRELQGLRHYFLGNFKDCDITFSGLDSNVAGEAEMSFLNNDIAIFSNAKNYRKDPIVPLVVPTVNLKHLDLIPHQRKHFGLSKGMLICNSNCAVIGIVATLKALQNSFGPVENVEVFTQQATSGAGYPGVQSSDILDNIQILIPGGSGGYAVSFGRVRETAKGSYFDLRFAALSHNTVIGAAGSSILNAEAAILKGFI